MLLETFRSLDGSCRTTGLLAAPDRSRELENLASADRLIARGAGLSYVTAAAGDHVTAVDMRHFNRLLSFDPSLGKIEVEAGISIGDLSGFLLQHGFSFPVLPGHPSITLGGALACGAHGKNHAVDGTIYEHVDALRLWHPDLGIRQLQRGDPSFEATIGGYGLTGIVLSTSLALKAFTATHARFAIEPARSLADAGERLLGERDAADFSYSWHDMARPGAQRSAGYIISGTFDSSIGDGGPVQFDANSPRPASGHGMALLNRLTLPVLNAVYAQKLKRLDGAVVPLKGALFPLASMGFYFRLFGPNGLIEHQVLVPEKAWPGYAEKLLALQARHDVPFTVASLKRFKGRRRLISFTGDGLALTIDLVNTPRAHAFLADVDILDCKVGAVANAIKDSRLPKSVFKQQAHDWPAFEKLRGQCDPNRRFHSALAERLGL